MVTNQQVLKNEKGQLLITHSAISMVKNFLYLIVISFLSFGCEETFLGEAEPNSPTNNFEILWNDFDQHYSLFEVRGINWKELYQNYRPQVTDKLSNEELWEIVTEMVEHLDDSHTTLYNGNTRYKSGYALNEQSTAEFSADLLISKYIDSKIEETSEDELLFGQVKDKNVGYIYLGSMGGSNPSVIDEIVKKFDNTEAIILDIRQNSGGEDRYSARIAKAFSDGVHEIYSVQTRNGRGYNDFDEKNIYHTQFDSNHSYTKPVIVLTDRKTISAGEVFLLHMKAFEHVTQIGDTTAGDFSTVSNMRFLPNGWRYVYSIQQFLLPNGESLDGIGHVPDVYAKNTVASINGQSDLVFEEALRYLTAEYGQSNCNQ
ncbi:S41 family peptidase [Cyclobacterium marinum]|uniref:Peptidase S41 n=1 Tax=Cyclobacterium marinum (strain ATCC 25205 / DSM 745 / LMG 13164 / NCIMB 1802) TaxID=880070 RepID=G0IYY6_CYCMS|nr:S41 family peptidase [Cyclobacterium marinum]AEL28131.1 peptidase S41 [Cyclobacterium marinum DSM 745]